jgi:hypothetical protein
MRSALLMNQQAKILPLYLGCQTNKGELIGISNGSLYIQSTDKNVAKYPIAEVGISLFLHLRKLSDLSPPESTKLIEKGLNTGRPQGYSFSPGAFIFLLSLNVDLFALIEGGLAKDITTVISPGTSET